MRIGLIVNPFAGLGGAVGLKGTDGPDAVAEAFRLGAKPTAGLRTRVALERLAALAPDVRLAAAAGKLGADWAVGLPLKVDIVDIGRPTGTAEDTCRAVTAMSDVDLVMFAGGDGTARDIAGVLPAGRPMLGIPCGVKMHSGVFAVSPGAAGSALANLAADGGRIRWNDEAEIMDIDEAALRAGIITPRLFGLARVPELKNLMQASKGGRRQDSAAALAQAATSIVGEMDRDVLYVVGPGTSAGAVMRAAGHTPTILGIDALAGGNVVARDARARDLEALSGDRRVRIVLGVTGQQGFLLGRGNQQISKPIVEKAGRDGLIVLATEDKLLALRQPRLWVDTGDARLDERISGFIRVRTGAGRQMMMRIGTG